MSRRSRDDIVSEGGKRSVRHKRVTFSDTVTRAFSNYIPEFINAKCDEKMHVDIQRENNLDFFLKIHNAQFVLEKNNKTNPTLMRILMYGCPKILLSKFASLLKGLVEDDIYHFIVVHMHKKHASFDYNIFKNHNDTLARAYLTKPHVEFLLNDEEDAMGLKEFKLSPLALPRSSDGVDASDITINYSVMNHNVILERIKCDQIILGGKSAQSYHILKKAICSLVQAGVTSFHPFHGIAAKTKLTLTRHTYTDDSTIQSCIVDYVHQNKNQQFIIKKRKLFMVISDQIHLFANHLVEFEKWLNGGFGVCKAWLNMQTGEFCVMVGLPVSAEKLPWQQNK